MHRARLQVKTEKNGTRKGGDMERTYLKVNEAASPPGLFEVVGISLEFI